MILYTDLKFNNALIIFINKRFILLMISLCIRYLVKGKYALITTPFKIKHSANIFMLHSKRKSLKTLKSQARKTYVK